jgi:hypothetical protein
MRLGYGNDLQTRSRAATRANDFSRRGRTEISLCVEQ